MRHIEYICLWCGVMVNVPLLFPPNVDDECDIPCPACGFKKKINGYDFISDVILQDAGIDIM